MSIEKNVLKIIQDRHIKPLSRWKFIVRNIVLWLLVCTCSLLVVLLIGVSMFHLSNGNNSIFDDLETPFIDQLITIIPLFWIGTTFVLALIAFLIFKTTIGYRRATMHFAALFLLIATICGAVIYITHGAEYLEEMFSTIPHYDNMIPTKRVLWNQAENGILGGIVVTDSTTTPFSIRAFDGDLWVIVGPLYETEGLILHKGVKVGVIGRTVNHGVFQAIEVRNW